MLFSEKLLIYSRMKIKYSANENFIYIMRYVNDTLDTESDPEKIIKEIEDFAMQIADTESTPEIEELELKSTDNEGESFEW